MIHQRMIRALSGFISMPEIVTKNPVNDPTQKPVKSHSKLTPDYSFLTTQLYGLNMPHFCMEAVADDDISMRVSCDTDTYTLKAPAMVPLKRNLDYFQIPIRALLPNTGELLVTNPLRGDDVVAANVNAVIDPSSSRYTGFISAFASALNTALTTTAAGVNAMESQMALLLRLVQIGNLFFSRGSLLANCAIDMGTPCFIGVTKSDGRLYNCSWDDLVDYVFAWFQNNVESMYVTFDSITQSSGFNNTYNFSVSSRTMNFNCQLGTQDARDHSAFSLVDLRNVLLTEPLLVLSLQITWLSSPESQLSFSVGGDTFTTVASAAEIPDQPINFLRPLAYQLACAEFYTSDTVDDVYSAKLWHQNQRALAFYLTGSYSTGVGSSFVYNGITIEYDPVSGVFLQAGLYGLTTLLNSGTTSSNISTGQVVGYLYFHNLLGFNRSLRYQDYFVGSRVNPLAVGNVSVNTSGGTVSVVDISKNIQIQRFLNQVNRVGRKFSEYVRGILGDKPMKDVHEPIFLGHIADTIGASETENTGSDQYSDNTGITSKFRDNSSRYCFDVHVSEPSVLIGITNYLLPMAYARGTDRLAMHVDRYEMFNPFMQFVGDQAVFNDELGPGVGSTFGYQIRYAEYRQRVDRAVGAFADRKLPGYANCLTPLDLSRYGSSPAAPSEISSDFIRVKPHEIDPFYLSLTGFSQTSRFHFICRYDISVTAHRPMAYAPSIL